MNASRSAAWRSALSSSDSAAPVIMSGISSGCPGVSWFRAARRTRAHSRWVVVASQPGSAAGSRMDARWSMSRSQTLWPASSASARPSPYLRQMDQIRGAYRSTSSSHACSSPVLARITRAVRSSCIAFASSPYAHCAATGGGRVLLTWFLGHSRAGFVSCCCGTSPRFSGRECNGRLYSSLARPYAGAAIHRTGTLHARARQDGSMMREAMRV